MYLGDVCKFKCYLESAFDVIMKKTFANYLLLYILVNCKWIVSAADVW